MTSRPSPSAPDSGDPFEANRGAMLGAAYSLLGSRADAEDVVQESWLRWSRVDRAAVREPRAYLLRTVTRQALNRLRAERTRRETYVGPWLPEPLVSDEDPARRITDRAEHAEQLTMAMLVVLEALSPEERCAFILREVFGIGYGEIASTLDRSEAAVRQIVHRAREHVRTRRPRFEADGETQRRVTRAFVAASLSGDTSALLALLAPDAVALSDGGGIVTAAINPIRGAGRVARFMAGIGTRASGERFSSAYVNGVFGAVGERDGRVTTVGVLDIVDGLVAGVYVIVNPDKLRHVRPG